MMKQYEPVRRVRVPQCLSVESPSVSDDNNGGMQVIVDDNILL